MALHTTTLKQKTNSQLVYVNPNCKYCNHTIEVCYWPGEEKEGQFPPGFGKREDVRGTCHDVAKQLSYYLFFFSFSFLLVLVLVSHKQMCESKMTHREVWDIRTGLGLLNVYIQYTKSNKKLH